MAGCGLFKKAPAKVLWLGLGARPALLGRGLALAQVVRHDLRLVATARDPWHGGALGAERLLAKEGARDFLLPKEPEEALPEGVASWWAGAAVAGASGHAAAGWQQSV